MAAVTGPTAISFQRSLRVMTLCAQFHRSSETQWTLSSMELLFENAAAAPGAERVCGGALADLATIAELPPTASSVF